MKSYAERRGVLVSREDVGADEAVGYAGVTAEMLARAVTPSALSPDVAQRVANRRQAARSRLMLTGTVKLRERAHKARRVVTDGLAVVAVGLMLGSGGAALHIPAVAERAEAATVRTSDVRDVVLRGIHAERIAAARMMAEAAGQETANRTWGPALSEWMQYQRTADALGLCQVTFEDGSTGYRGQNPAVTVWAWFLVEAGMQGVEVPC